MYHNDARFLFVVFGHVSNFQFSVLASVPACREPATDTATRTPTETVRYKSQLRFSSRLSPPIVSFRSTHNHASHTARASGRGEGEWNSSACVVMRSNRGSSDAGGSLQRLHVLLIGVASTLLVLTTLRALSGDDGGVGGGGDGGHAMVGAPTTERGFGGGSDGAGGGVHEQQQHGGDGDGEMDFMSSPEFLRMSQTDRLMV